MCTADSAWFVSWSPPSRLSTQADLVIKPESVTPSLDASKWPLLLKNYDRLNVRSRRIGFSPKPETAQLLGGARSPWPPRCYVPWHKRQLRRRACQHTRVRCPDTPCQT